MAEHLDQRARVAYFVPPSEHFAGIERVVHEIASGLMEDYGDVLDVHVLFSSHYDEPILKNPLYKLHTLRVDRLRHLATTLRACVRQQDFDVLICPQIEASVIGWLATRGLRIPLFLSHLHGNPRVEEKDGSRRTKIAFSFFRHVVSRRIAGILAVSPSLKKYAADSVTRGAKVYYAPNPVRDVGGNVTRTASNGPYRFLNVGRLSRQKGQDILLRALALARPDLPAVSLTLVGTGSDEDELRSLSSDLDLEDIVTFAGYTSEPASHFRSADCFVLASRWEGFGVVLVEALQFGLPLLAADCEFGPSDVITGPSIGSLVPAESAEALAEGLKDAALRGPDYENDALRRTAAREFGRQAAVQAHFGILEQIVAARPRQSDRLAALTAIRDSWTLRNGRS